MNSREKILAAIKKSQPAPRELPVLDFPLPDDMDAQEKFIAVLSSIGGAAHTVGSYDEIQLLINREYNDAARIISLVPEIESRGQYFEPGTNPHLLEDVDLAVIKAQFGVAENAAVWITDDMLPERVLSFITQNLAVVLHRRDILQLMHQAYERIGGRDYGFGVFIAGPSKTADIEQSLVLGAHGSRTMRIFILQS
ncbi:MAG: LUD domain-containing protein [Chitinophagaceae bacterium]|nr:LUD domain-containing protein [Chitinophagaceae bacterium]